MIQGEPGSDHPHVLNSMAALGCSPDNVHAISLPLFVCPALGYRRLSSADYLPQAPLLLAFQWVWPLAGIDNLLEGESRGRRGA